uniref:Serine/arginine-rich splicing factor 3-like n=1 Tax=Phallusia mammillata TaxID=59560 RepID=A0A6F9DU84_9ASCI|nr:serine/arginine-rich splicing factor 3-like [Phallusia mammillata]
MASFRNSGPLDCKVYVGNLGSQGSKSELERVFGYYGQLKNVWVARNPPGFAFVEFEDNRDAEDAVRALDGRTICGVRARVEMSNGMTRRGNERGGRGGGRRDDHDDRRRRYDRSRSRSPRRNRERYSRSYSRSPRRNRRSKSGSRSPYGRDHSVSPRRSLSPVRKHSISRSRSPSPINGRDSRSRSRS